MPGAEDLLLFNHLLRKPDKELDLERAALLIAEAGKQLGEADDVPCDDARPSLDIARCVAQLDQLGEKARVRILRSGFRPGRAPVSVALTAILSLLYKEEGFRGNVADYYDPRNSFLDDVLERRTGIPITLALVLIGVARRAGLRLEGVSFPGHFLVRATLETGGHVFIDPFEGRITSREEMDAVWEATTGHPGPVDDTVLAPATRRQIIARLLNNLRCIYEIQGDGRRLCQVLAQLAAVSPSPEAEQRLERARQQPPAPRISIN
jgi:regulator of sirC expression with transglutaminase-like and TPR domain